MKILLVDDDWMSRESLTKFLKVYLKHEVISCENVHDALEEFEKYSFPLVISDIRMPELSGIDFLRKIREEDCETDVVLITGFGETETAVQALRLGAYDYLQKPIEVDELAALIKRIEIKNRLKSENKKLKNKVKEYQSENQIINSDLNKYQSIYQEVFGLGKVAFFSKKMKEIEKKIKIFNKDRDINVLIQGDTGTGKEVVARLIHFQNNEAIRPFVTVNCSAISPSLFESELFGYEEGAFTGAKSKGKMGKFDLAQNGTIFFDEIGDMPLEMQPKLLRVLQMKEFCRIGGTEPISLDVRIICATNRNLEKMIENNLFRRDLFFRINTAALKIPNLNQRKDAIIPLTELFLKEFSKTKGKKFSFVGEDAKEILKNHKWEGNIRELRNVIERIVILNDAFEVNQEHLQNLIDCRPNQNLTSNKIVINLPEDELDYLELEKSAILQILNKFNGNKTKTAKYLHISRNRLNRKLK